MAREQQAVPRYGRVAQTFHWVVAALVFVQVTIGVHAADLPLGIERIKWMSRHKAIGITILVLVVLRLSWRFIKRPPAFPEGLPAWQRLAARLNHVVLYVLLLAAPMTGWLAASAAGLGISWFGVFTVPALIDKTPGLVEYYEAWHEGLVITLAAFVLLHMAAAVWHVLNRDGVMERMLPRALQLPLNGKRRRG